MANKFYKNAGHFYAPHIMPVLLDCTFQVAPADTGGFGVIPLAPATVYGPGIQSVYMHTTATPAVGNPNPAAGIIVVRLSDNYPKYLGVTAGFNAPLNGSNSTSTTANVINVITNLGTATQAQWVAVGLPVGTTPAVGVAFVATSSSAIGGGADVQLAATAGSGIDHIEVVGNPNLSLTVTYPSTQGGFLYLECFSAGTLTAPAAGTVIGLQIYLDNSSV